jgi:phosphate-selective porin OprO and OprP
MFNFLGKILIMAYPSSSRPLLAFAGVLGFLMTSIPAGASSPSETAQLKEQIKLLKQQLTTLETKVNQNQQSTLQTNEKVEKIAKKSEETPKSASSSDIKVKLKPAPSLSTADGRTTFEIDGRVIGDVGFIADKDGHDYGDAAQLRHLWLGFKGKIDEEWNYRLQVGFDNNQVAIKDAYIGYTGFKNVSLMAGQFYENNGLEIMSTNLNTTFMEPSAGIGAFRGTQRYLGATIDPYGTNWGGQFGYFGTTVDDNSKGDEGYAFAGRLHTALLNTKDSLIHVGGNVRHRAVDSSTGQSDFALKARGDSYVIDEPLLSTGAIANVDSEQDYALEALFRYKGLYATGEYDFTTLQRNGASDMNFDGGYATVGYVLTGEQREYNPKRGTQGRLIPSEPFSMSGKGWGAFEIAGRYDHLNLNSDSLKAGTYDSYTLGLNWYPTAQTRFMVNYVVNDVKGAQNSTVPAPNGNPQYIMGRAQIDF